MVTCLGAEGWPQRWREGMEGAGHGGRMDIGVREGRVVEAPSFWLGPLWSLSLKKDNEARGRSM